MSVTVPNTHIYNMYIHMYNIDIQAYNTWMNSREYMRKTYTPEPAYDGESS